MHAAASPSRSSAVRRRRVSRRPPDVALDTSEKLLSSLPTYTDQLAALATD